MISPMMGTCPFPVRRSSPRPRYSPSECVGNSCSIPFLRLSAALMVTRDGVESRRVSSRREALSWLFEKIILL